MIHYYFSLYQTFTSLDRKPYKPTCLFSTYAKQSLSDGHNLAVNMKFDDGGSEESFFPGVLLAGDADVECCASTEHPFTPGPNVPSETSIGSTAFLLELFLTFGGGEDGNSIAPVAIGFTPPL